MKQKIEKSDRFKMHKLPNGKPVNGIELHEISSFSRSSDLPKTDYEGKGFDDAKKMDGLTNSLFNRLKLLWEDFKDNLKMDNNSQARLKTPYETKLRNYKVQVDFNEEKIDEINLNVNDIDNKIDEKRNEISDIKNNPESIMPDKISKVGLIIGAIILSILTVYLFIFYSSASYSAFFKSFSLNDLGVASSIFDPKAIAVAYENGVTELMLIITMPFVFIGLGFLIHQYQNKEGIMKYFQIISLILVTFIFDVILAYEITEKIYDLKAENSFAEIPPYSFELAFQSVNFWLIIFAGFVVYIIWGFVFDFTIKSYEKKDVVDQSIKTKKKEIKRFEEKKEVFKKQIAKIKSEIAEIKSKIIALEEKLNGFIIDKEAFEKRLRQYVAGWTHWQNANKRPQTDIDDVHKQAELFLEEFNNN